MNQFSPALAAQFLSRAQPEGPDITAQAGVPPLLFDEPASQLQRESARLHSEVDAFAQAHADRVQDVRRDAETVVDAKAALDAEIAREARERTPDAGRLTDLAHDYERAKARATEEVHTPRVRLAYDHYIEALDAYETWLRAHVEELMEELRPEAEKVAADWQREHTRARRLLDPVEARHRTLHARQSAMASYQQKIRRSLAPEGNVAWHPSHTETLELLTVPADQFGTPPVPTREAIADYVAHVRPASAEPNRVMS